jgi:hypothetical protein
MEHNVSYLMALVDRMSAPAEKIAAKFKNINTTISQVQGGLDRVGKAQGLNKLKGSADRIPRSISEIQEKLKLLNAELNNTHSSKSFINLRKEIKATEQQLSGLTSKLSGSLGGGMGSLLTKGLATLGAYFGAQQIFSFAKGSLEAYDEEAKARAQLKAGLVSTRFASGKNVEGLEDLAIRQENKTLFRHDQTMGAEAVLLTFSKIRGKIYDEAIPAIQDLTTRFGGDLATNARMVGKALNEPGQALLNLRRMGIQFSDSQTKNIKNLVKTGHQYEAQLIILAKLNEKFGGSAEAAAKAGIGPMQQLGNKFHTLSETLGENMAPNMNKFADSIGKVVDHFRDFIKIPVADKINDEIGQIIALQGELTSANTSEERRKAILLELKDIEPDITKGITAESLDFTVLATNIQGVINKLYEKIALSNLDEKTAKNLTDTKEKATEIGKDLGAGFSSIWKLVDKNIINRPDLDNEGKLLLGAQLAHSRIGSLYRTETIAIHGTPGERRVDVYKEAEEKLREEAKRIKENQHAIDLNNTAQKAIDANVAALKVAFHDEGDTKPSGLAPQGGTPPDPNAPDPNKEIDGISSGGSKATNITVNLKDLIGVLNLHSNSVAEGGKKVDEILTEGLLRVLNSANRAATQ